MPAYPDGAAGVKLADGTILSGDDAPAWRAAGFRCVQCHVQCSARVAAGEYEVGGRLPLVTVAVDLNGADLRHVAALIGAQCAELAVGIFDGETQRALVGMLPAEDVAAAHATLLEKLPGFGCFAVLT